MIRSTRSPCAQAVVLHELELGQELQPDLAAELATEVRGGATGAPPASARFAGSSPSAV